MTKLLQLLKMVAFLALLLFFVDGGASVLLNSNCDCGWYNRSIVSELITRRIVGGKATVMNEFPMMAALVDDYWKQLYCGATIVSKKFAVTAAHCSLYRDIGNIYLIVGAHFMPIPTRTAPAKDVTTAANTHKVKRFIVHPKYNIDTQLNDIALVETEKHIEFNGWVGPACLPFRYRKVSLSGQPVLAVGWGVTKWEGTNSEVLKKVNLTAIPVSTCSSLYRGGVTQDQICTYADKEDACQNDSGGPILYISKKMQRIYLVGIISYGVACATDMPGVNTRVSSYVDWIKSQTSDMQYCVI